MIPVSEFICERCGEPFTASRYKRYCSNRCNATRHGYSAKRSPTYNSWTAMRDRCLNSNNRKWPIYGGRGITICRRWDDFENFLADMGERPEGKTLDRISPDGHYDKENCRWATAKEQAETRRPRSKAPIRDPETNRFVG